MSDSNAAVAEPEVETLPEAEEQTERRSARSKPKRQPPYHVILWDDPDHSYEYVMLMMKRLFRMPLERGFKSGQGGR